MRYIIILLILPFMAFSDSPKSLMLKGNEAFEAGKSAEAIENYDNALKILPNNPYLTYNKGIAAYADKNYEIALGHFREAHKLTLEAPKRDLAFESGCLASAGDALFQQAKAISENKENQMQNLDTALQMSSEAAANYENAIKVYPKNKAAESAIKQAKLLNKKLLTIKKQQEKQQDQNKQDQNKQDQNKQDQNKQDQNKQDQNKQDQNKQDQNKQDQNKQDQEKQDQNKQDQEKQQEKDSEQPDEEADREAMEIIDQEKNDKKERRKILMKNMKYQPVEQDW